MSDQVSSIVAKLKEIVSNGPKVYQQGIYEGSYQYWASVQNYGRRTDYSYAFARWAGETIEPPYTINTDNCMYMFLDCHNVKNLSSIRINHTSDNPNLMYLCSNCIQLESPPVLAFNNTHNIRTFTSMFSNCTNLKSCNIWWGDGTEDPLTVRANCANMFFKCYELTDIAFSGTGSPRSLDLSYCNKLSANTISSLAASLADVAAATSGNFNIKLSTTTYDTLSTEMKKVFTNKGWTLQSDSHKEPEAADPLYKGLITSDMLTAEFLRGVSLKQGSYYKASEVFNATFTLVKLPISDDSGLDSWVADSDNATSGKHIFTLTDELANVVGNISGFNSTTPPTVCFLTNSGVKSHTMDENMAYVSETKTLQETVSKTNNTQLKLSQKYVWDYLTLSANYIVSCAVDEYLYWNGMYWEKRTEAPATLPTSFTKINEFDFSTIAAPDLATMIDSTLLNELGNYEARQKGDYYVVKPMAEYSGPAETTGGIDFKINVESEEVVVSGGDKLSDICTVPEGMEDIGYIKITLPNNKYKAPSKLLGTQMSESSLWSFIDAYGIVAGGGICGKYNNTVVDLLGDATAAYQLLELNNGYISAVIFTSDQLAAMRQAAVAYNIITASSTLAECITGLNNVSIDNIICGNIYNITVQPYETRNRFLIWNGQFWESSDTLALA